MLKKNEGSYILETGILRINLEWIKKYLGFLCILILT
ncbi:MAG: hypothetical protein MPEBLZ_00389, partial [Candidatus Methanoperedens nitroreducens]